MPEAATVGGSPTSPYGENAWERVVTCGIEEKHILLLGLNDSYVMMLLGKLDELHSHDL